MLWGLKRTSTTERRNFCLCVRILAPDTSASKKTSDGKLINSLFSKMLNKAQNCNPHICVTRLSPGATRTFSTTGDAQDFQIGIIS